MTTTYGLPLRLCAFARENPSPMVRPIKWLSIAILVLAACSSLAAQVTVPVLFFDVKKFGAKGDGKALDSPAINKAIDAAAAAGGGTVLLTAGTYRAFSIRLRSNVAPYIDQGATILAASPNDGDGKYDLPEPNQWDVTSRYSRPVSTISLSTT